MANDENSTFLNQADIALYKPNPKRKDRKRNSKKLKEVTIISNVEVINEEENAEPIDQGNIVYIAQDQQEQNKNTVQDVNNNIIPQIQQETSGGGAVLGAVSGVALGIMAGLATGPLAPIAVPVFAITGYFGGMYVGDKVESGSIALMQGTFTAKIKNFFADRIYQSPRTIGGIVGLIAGIGLSVLTGPAFWVALPVATFFCSKIGAELGQNIFLPLTNGFGKVSELFREVFPTNMNIRKKTIEAIRDKLVSGSNLDKNERIEYVIFVTGKDNTARGKILTMLKTQIDEMNHVMATLQNAGRSAIQTVYEALTQTNKAYQNILTDYKIYQSFEESTYKAIGETTLEAIENYIINQIRTNKGIEQIDKSMWEALKLEHAKETYDRGTNIDEVKGQAQDSSILQKLTSKHEQTMSTSNRAHKLGEFSSPSTPRTTSSLNINKHKAER